MEEEQNNILPFLDMMMAFYQHQFYTNLFTQDYIFSGAVLFPNNINLDL